MSYAARTSDVCNIHDQLGRVKQSRRKILPFFTPVRAVARDRGLTRTERFHFDFLALRFSPRLFSLPRPFGLYIRISRVRSRYRETCKPWIAICAGEKKLQEAAVMLHFHYPVRVKSVRARTTIKTRPNLSLNLASAGSLYLDRCKG